MTEEAWREIESAPRDGSEVLLFHEHHGAIQGRFCPGEWSESTPISPAEYSGAVWVLGDDLEQVEVEELPADAPLGLTAWHGALLSWQPLPAPPTNTKGE